MGIGAGDHQDRVLARRSDFDHGNAGGAVDRADRRQVHTARIQFGERMRAERIAADGADHGHSGTGPRRGQCLIRAFAPRVRRERIAGQRFAGLRKTRHPGDEIEVDGSEYDDHGARRAYADISAKARSG